MGKARVCFEFTSLLKKLIRVVIRGPPVVNIIGSNHITG